MKNRNIGLTILCEDCIEFTMPKHLNSVLGDCKFFEHHQSIYSVANDCKKFKLKPKTR